MKLIKSSVIIIFFAVCVFNSCKNDLDLNAPYKEIPSIYALINPQDKIQMIRVNKVFLGETDANQMAQIADSINYPAGELTVTLNRFEGGKQVDACPTCPDAASKRTIVFRDSVITAADGAFNKQQRVYVSGSDLHIKLPVPNPSNKLDNGADWRVTGDYVLTVKNNRTGNVFTAKATAIDSVKPGGARPFNAPVYPYPLPIPPLIDYVDYASNDGGVVRFFPNSATVYQLKIRVHYYEVASGANYFKYVDYDLGNRHLKDIQKLGGTDFLSYSFKKSDFFTAMGVGLGKQGLNNNISGRKAYKIEYIVYTTTQDYEDYLQFVTPSLSIAQSKTLYSNFENRAALGIFTFRTRSSISKEMATAFVSEFAYNSNTCAYQFYTASDQKPGCN